MRQICFGLFIIEMNVKLSTSDNMNKMNLQNDRKVKAKI